MKESKRLAAWLDAHAKYMKHQDEQSEMRRAARQLRSLEHEIESNLDALQKAHEMLAEMKSMLQEVAGVPKQEAPREAKRITLSGLWR